MKKRILTILLLGVMAASLMPLQASFATVISTRTLWAGQTINVGTLTVEVIGTDLVVTFETTGGWYLTETHLYVGTSIPTKSAPGQFPYKHDNLGGVTSDSYTIPLADIGTGWRVFAAHAVVENQCECLEETAWGNGCEKIRPGKNWAMYFWNYIPPPT